ncbi:TetR family transcriptional regulator [Pseudodesulfovibrio cashew]|uniref:TetR family transcriptional regulator n=1 Tax=Pseudodesulfovibrio cashew TaxID=2678688 RepID=A0A6I6JSH9_9BACT|nr:TetR/AcrR family transcriptional regulator [Pseudodesulfovibrio cashew]QGY40514.1 TetR family transcriptional regulator [Pseudodesulfovibrio cashew]
MKEYSEKETRILDTAADLFAKQPFHKVLLSDVARAASVGKGTLYLYFKSKEDLYFAVLFRGFDVLVDRLQKILSDKAMPPDEQLTAVVRDLAEHIYGKATNVELLGVVMTCPTTDEWSQKRRELWALIEEIIRRGVAQGVFEDATPALTAKYIPGLIRSVCLFKPEGVDIKTICNHACDFVLRGLKKA